MIKLGVIALCVINLAYGQVSVVLNEKYRATWKLLNDKEIEFLLEVETTGFIGFGINTIGSMTAADIVIGGKYTDGSSYFTDRHATGMDFPNIDESQDYNLLEATENNTHTTLRFTRLLSTCDDDDTEITSDRLSIIWSYGETDDIQYHGENRGSKNVNFLDGKMPDPDLSKFKTWELTANTTMPSALTTYWCTIHKTPSFQNVTPHMVGFNVILESLEAVRHTHHVDIYKCKAPDGNDYNLFEPWVGTPGADCYYGGSNPFHFCEWIQYGWAIGGAITLFPEDYGFPLKGDDYYMLEIHYDNPQGLADISFKTGMTMYYQDEPRPIEAAQFLVGSTISYTQMIPPNSVNFINVVHCEAKCTDQFPEEGISVFNILLHSHFSGRKMKVRHFRNGVELPWPISDENYDFNYQQNRPLKEEFKFLRGDRITLECTYDTTWKKGKPVIGGRATTEEMCIAFFFYYPRMPNLVECNSEMPQDVLFDFFGIEEVFDMTDGQEDPIIKAPLHMQNKTFQDIIMEYNWTQEARDLYQFKHRFEPQNGDCLPLGPEGYPASYPSEFIPYEKPNTCTGNQMNQNVGFWVLGFLMAFWVV